MILKLVVMNKNCCTFDHFTHENWFIILHLNLSLAELTVNTLCFVNRQLEAIPSRSLNISFTRENLLQTIGMACSILTAL